MKTLHLLLGSAERRLSATIEATVLDVCYNRAAVHSTKIPRIGDFVRYATCGSYDFLILATDHLLAETRQAEPGPEALVQAIWTIKNRCSAPLLLIGNSNDLEYRFLEAGADAMLVRQTPFKTEELRSQVESLLSLPEAEEEPAPPQPRWTLARLLKRNR